MDTKSSLHDIDEVTKQLKVEIPIEMIDREIDTVLSNLSKTTKVKGFRPGKAPRQMVEQMHGERVRYEVANRLISSTLYDLVKKHQLDMIGDPEIDVSNFEAGKEIQYTANISLFPKPEVKNFSKFEVEVQKREVTPKDVDQVIDRIRTSKATTKKLDFRNKAQAGDVIDSMLEVKIEGVEEQTRPEPLVIGLGEGNLPKELEEGIIGMEIGQTKEIEGKMPEDHREESVRGKKTIFKVTLNSLSEKILPELDDDFAKTLEFGVQSVLELRLDITKRLEQENEKETKNDIQAAILAQLLDSTPFQVPQILVDEEIRQLISRSGIVDPSKTDLSKISVDPFRKELGEAATKRVRTAILVDRIGEVEKLAATEEDIDKSVAEIAEQNGISKEEVKKFFMDKERIVRFVLEITRNKVLDFLRERTTVKYTDKPKAEK